MTDELTSQGQIGDDDEAQAPTLLPRSASETFIHGLVEIFNPFEAFEIVFDEPGAGLMAIAGLVAIVFVAVGLWSVVQELLVGGGPPQGLGLN